MPTLLVKLSGLNPYLIGAIFMGNICQHFTIKSQKISSLHEKYFITFVSCFPTNFVIINEK
jgi:hypothetical protein